MFRTPNSNIPHFCVGGVIEALCVVFLFGPGGENATMAILSF